MSNQKLTILSLARKGLSYFRGYHLALFAGTALSAMVLSGALLVGDSVTRSLGLYAEQRLGSIEHAINLPHRFVSQDFADELSREVDADIAGVLRLRGSVSGGDRTDIGLTVNVIGVDDSFWQAAGVKSKAIGRTGVLINRRVATLAGFKEGDILSLTVERPSPLSRDLPLSARSTEQHASVSLKVAAALGDDEMGKFSMRAEQVPALNIFVDRQRLQEIAGLGSKINTVLAGPSKGGALSQAVRKVWRLEHSGYRVSARKDNTAALESDRIFMDPIVAEAAAAAGGEGASGYLLNDVISLQDTNRNSPYPFILAGARFVPVDIAADEVVINSWLAKVLDVEENDSLKLKYYRFEGANELVAKERSFRVRKILRMKEATKAQEMMPAFPGLSDADSCSDWDIGMPLDEEKVADKKNQEYWDDYRDTPKLFVSLGVGVEMWGNHFGDVTSFQLGVAGDHALSDLAMKKRIEADVDPTRLGLAFIPVAEQAEQAVSEAMSFGGLFISLSFFLIVAAVLITGLIFSFTVVKRSRELGVLRAVGFSARRAANVFLLEGAAVAVPGAIAGTMLGVFYTKGFLGILNRFWSGAVAGSIIVFDAQPGSLAVGIVATTLLVLCTVLYSVRRLSKKEAVELLSGRASEEPERRKSGRRWLAIGMACGIAAVATVLLAAEGKDELNAFFGAGTLALLAGLSAGKFWIDRLGSGASLSVRYVGLRNAARRHERSMAVVVLMALGCFMVFSVACMKEDPTKDAGEKWSGTGGFDLIVELAVPIQDEMLSWEGLQELGFRAADALDRSMIVPCKVRDGDDASCLNLNRARVPVVIGVDAALMARLGAFGPMKQSIETWGRLSENQDGAVPVIAGDNETVMWGLGIRPGDTLQLTDENGAMFEIVLTGALPVRRSILQGRLLMSLKEFVRKYSAQDGYNMLLIDCPAGWEDIVARAIEQRLRKYGPTVTPTTERLRQLYAVENTYMGMFAALGGLGLLIGALGVGIVATLNILQRRSELALLRAVGYRRVTAGMVIFSEYAFLFIYGVVVGGVSAVVAVWPNVRSMGADLPLSLLAAILAGTLAVGLLSILVAGWMSLKGSPVDALRSE